MFVRNLIHTHTHRGRACEEVKILQQENQGMILCFFHSIKIKINDPQLIDSLTDEIHFSIAWFVRCDAFHFVCVRAHYAAESIDRATLPLDVQSSSI